MVNTFKVKWSARKLAFTSITLSFLEIVAFASVIVALAFMDEPITRSLTARKITGIAWILCGPTSVAFACAGLFLDSRRGSAAIALVVAVASWIFCSLQILV